MPPGKPLCAGLPNVLVLFVFITSHTVSLPNKEAKYPKSNILILSNGNSAHIKGESGREKKEDSSGERIHQRNSCRGDLSNECSGNKECVTQKGPRVLK
jgi:hypothetical protein